MLVYNTFLLCKTGGSFHAEFTCLYPSPGAGGGAEVMGVAIGLKMAGFDTLERFPWTNKQTKQHYYSMHLE